MRIARERFAHEADERAEMAWVAGVGAPREEGVVGLAVGRLERVEDGVLAGDGGFALGERGGRV